MLVAAFAFLTASLAIGLYGLRHAGYEVLISLVMLGFFVTSFVLAALWLQAL